MFAIVSDSDDLLLPSLVARPVSVIARGTAK